MTEANILLVDDDAQFCAILKKRLTVRDMEIFLASSGDEALQQLAVHDEIEVIILDVNMPGRNGMEMLQIFKQRYPLVEVIMLTGHATLESAIDGMRLGAFDYLIKPCAIDVLVRKVMEAVDKKRRHEEKIVDAKVREMASRLQ
ncbi:MAG: response regulator [Desulfovibrionales bacterium]|nr:response regulator [Desulfovibrionales bacterium]